MEQLSILELLILSENINDITVLKFIRDEIENRLKEEEKEKTLERK